MSLLKELIARGKNPDAPFLVDGDETLSLRDIEKTPVSLKDIGPGEVVALVGDIDASTISALLGLIERKAVIMPLTRASEAQHPYFMEAGDASVLISDGKISRLKRKTSDHPLIANLRERGSAGLILFTSGSTGQPKAILHDFSRFLARYDTPRPAWRTINFLLFDHIGGLNTLFHTIYNGGLIVRPSGRNPDAIVTDIRKHDVELLPTTPTFLRLWEMAGIPAQSGIPSLRLITYGTERMDQHTLTLLANALPDVAIRQTYGLSELGILRIRTRKRDELWIQVGGEGVETLVKNGELYLRTKNRMEGYLNAPAPFDDEGWYPTKDLVEIDGQWIRITGRRDTLINVGGLKVLPAEVEHAALEFPGISFAKASGVPNPLTGMHVELLCETTGESVDKKALLGHLRASLPPHAVPLRVNFGKVKVGHRFKQL